MGRNEILSDPLINSTDAFHIDSRSTTGTFDALIASIGATPVTLLINRQETITTNLTIPSTIKLKFTPHGSFTIASPFNCTIQTIDIDAENYQLFFGTGDFDFADNTKLKNAWFSTLNTAITYIGSIAEVVLSINTKPADLTANLSIGSNISIEWKEFCSLGGAFILTISSPNKLIVNNDIFLFESVLTVVFTNAGTVYPEWWGINGVADEVQINAAITSIPAGNIILNNTYIIDASITGDSSINLIGMANNTTITINTSYINAYSADTKTDISISGIKWIGSGDIVAGNEERLLYFISCTDISVTQCEFTNSIIGIQIQTCTRVKINNDTFISLLSRDDGSEGYGILCNLDNDSVIVNSNHFYDVERHCVYFSSGSSNCIASNNVANNSGGGSFVAYTLSTQNTARNIQYINNIVNTITPLAAGTGDIAGIIATGNINGLIISGNQIYNVTNRPGHGGGIFVQHGSSYVNTLKNVTITDNIIDTIVGGPGIDVLNGENIVITGNQIKNIDTVAQAYSGINISASGTDVGSFVKNILIDNNTIDTGRYGIVITGVSAVYKTTGVILGHNRITNVFNNEYNMNSIDYIEYKTTWDTVKIDSFINVVEHSKTNSLMAGLGSTTYRGFLVPFSGFLYSMYAKIDGAITNESITFNLTQNTAVRSNTVAIVAGDLYEKTFFALNERVVNEGDVIHCAYTTPAGFLPSGSNDVLCGIEIIKKCT